MLKYAIDDIELQLVSFSLSSSTLLSPIKRISKITTAQIQQQVIKWGKSAAAPLNGRQKRTTGQAKRYKLQFNIINRI
ncbi:hypothetical protein ACI3PF_20045, partial [Lactococcus lactis]